MFDYKSRSRTILRNMSFLKSYRPIKQMAWIHSFQRTDILGVEMWGECTFRDQWLASYVLFIPSLTLESWGLKYCFLLTGAYGPEHWVTSSVSCGGRHQSPIDILDQHARVGEEYQELQLEGFDNESSNKTWMKNTGKTGRRWLFY